MTTIIQDYKDYRKAKKNAKLAADAVNKQFQKMLQPISFSELNKYTYEKGLLAIYGNAVYDGKNKQALIEYLDKKAPLVHLPSCFCTVLASSCLKPHGIVQNIFLSGWGEEERAKCTIDKAIRCLHNPEDGVIIENYCANCPKDKFKNLVEYHSLNGDLQKAEQNLATAKQKLRGRFSFARQK